MTMRCEPLVLSWLTLEQFCGAVGADADWVLQRASAGLLTACPSGGQGRGNDPIGISQFDAITLRRARRMLMVERTYDAAPELAALVADLHDEIDCLRGQLTKST